MGTRQSSNRPTVHEISSCIRSFVPLKAGDVQFVYHQPFSSAFDATRFTIQSVVLSITPTVGFYSSLNNGAKLGFLHRPWTLARRHVPRNATILANHKGFDEVLTVGFNVQLARRLGLDLNLSVHLQGYKGDPERRIGIVAPLANGPEACLALKARILMEFNNETEGTFGFDSGSPGSEVPEDTISTVAIMNAFHPEEVDRALAAAVDNSMLRSAADANRILYLTGAVREAGLQYAREKGMNVICVGHQVCEEWGIRFLAGEIRKTYPTLRVEEIFEPEEPREQTEA